MSVLAKNALLEYLERGEIFASGSWDETCLRQAGYDLRVAPEYLVAPDGKRYWPDNPEGATACRASFWLEPGESAFVSTIEILHMPLNVAGNIAEKFRLAQRGLLVMGGLLVDPGYGMERLRNGTWGPTPGGGRLHFQLANIGKVRIKVVPGKTNIAGIQFLELAKAATVEELSEWKPPTSDALLEDMFGQGDSEPLAQLAFFSEVRSLRADVERLDKQVENQRIGLETTRRSTDNLVVFGVFLIAITLFTVAVAALLSALAGGDVKTAAIVGEEVDFSWVAFAVAAALLAVVSVVCWFIMRPVREIFRSRRTKESVGEAS